MLLIRDSTEVGRLPDIDKPVYVISKVVLLPLNQIPAKDLDIAVCCAEIVLALISLQY